MMLPSIYSFTGLRQIVFVTLSRILVAKVLHPLIALSGLHTVVFKQGALKTRAGKLLDHMTLDILAISLTISRQKF